MRTTIAEAILSLKPGSEFTYSNDDYSTIEWIVLEGNAPTKKQIDDEIKRLEIAKITDLEARAQAKAELLARLGITAEEAQLLLA